jgi:hypothetical protein
VIHFPVSVVASIKGMGVVGITAQATMYQDPLGAYTFVLSEGARKRGLKYAYLSLPIFKLDMKTPNMENVAVMSSLRIYFSTAALLSNAFASLTFPPVTAWRWSA